MPDSAETARARDASIHRVNAPRRRWPWQRREQTVEQKPKITTGMGSQGDPRTNAALAYLFRTGTLTDADIIEAKNRGKNKPEPEPTPDQP